MNTLYGFQQLMADVVMPGQTSHGGGYHYPTTDYNLIFLVCVFLTVCSTTFIALALIFFLRRGKK